MPSSSGEHLTGLSALTLREFFTDPWWRRVMLGTFHSVKIIADGSIEAHFPVSAALGYRDGD